MWFSKGPLKCPKLGNSETGWLFSRFLKIQYLKLEEPSCEQAWLKLQKPLAGLTEKRLKTLRLNTERKPQTTLDWTSRKQAGYISEKDFKKVTTSAPTVAVASLI